jgi:hypothetical protein
MADASPSAENQVTKPEPASGSQRAEPEWWPARWARRRKRLIPPESMRLRRQTDHINYNTLLPRRYRPFVAARKTHGTYVPRENALLRAHSEAERFNGAFSTKISSTGNSRYFAASLAAIFAT